MDVLLVEKENCICTLALNRPEKRNALNLELLTRLGDTFRALGKDREVRVVIIRGAGDKGFCAGFDLSEFDEELVAIEEGRSFINYATSAILNYPYPVIACIHGFAHGGGFGLASVCDFRITADTARFSVPTARIGGAWYPLFTLNLLHLVGVSKTKEILFLGRIFDAQKAKEIGFVDQIVAESKLLSTTYDLAQEIAKNSPITLSTLKAMLSKLLPQMPSGDATRALVALQLYAYKSEDAKEGARAFLEKRTPRFRHK